MFTGVRGNSMWESAASSIIGATVYGRDREKLGTVEDLLLDTDRKTIKYAIIDTGGWLKSHRFLVPADVLRDAEIDSGDFILPELSKPQIEALPPIDKANFRSDSDFDRYEQQYRASWPMRTASVRRGTGRLARFEQGLRESATGTLENNVEASRQAAFIERAGATATFGVYDQRADLENAVRELKDAGFEREDISLLLPDKDASQRLSFEYATKAPEGIATGATTGAVVGGSLGWLASIGMIAIPGIGPLLAAGPIVAALAGVGAAGAIGGIAGGLIGLGMPELEAKRYQGELAKGGVLLAVQCSDVRFAESAKRILDSTGARDVLVTGQEKAA